MVCKTYQIKVDKSHLSKTVLGQLRLLFLEAKWFINHIIASGVFSTDYKTKTVSVKKGDKFEDRQIQILPAQIRQSLLDKLKQDIKNLSIKKNNGHKVGRLKFKRFVRTIPLRQYGETYAICGKNHIKIQGIKKKLRVRGLRQIPDGVEFANAYLIQDHGDYYIRVVTYQQRVGEPVDSRDSAVGIDFGLRNQITLSNGIAVQYRVPVATGKLRRLYKRFSRTEKGSHNRFKIQLKLQRQYARTNNIKSDIKNKIAHCIKNHYSIVCYQDDDMHQWQRIWGSKVLDTAIGGLKGIFDTRIPTPIVVDNDFPSTNLCSNCGAFNNISLAEEIYSCPECGFTMHRDWKAARDILYEGVRQLPAERRKAALLRQGRQACGEETSTRMLEYLNSIPYTRASFLYETGSFTALA